jgi:hypothetical protein
MGLDNNGAQVIAHNEPTDTASATANLSAVALAKISYSLSQESAAVIDIESDSAHSEADADGAAVHHEPKVDKEVEVYKLPDEKSFPNLNLLSIETQSIIYQLMSGFFNELAKIKFVNSDPSGTKNVNNYILNLRLKEINSVAPDPAEIRDTLLAIDFQKKLLRALHDLRLILETQAADSKDSGCYFPPIFITGQGFGYDVLKELRQSVILAREEILYLSDVIFVAENSRAQLNNIKLLYEATKSLQNFYQDPLHPEYTAQLLNVSNKIHREMGSRWRPIKQAIAVVFATTCMLVALLGAIPSFAASFALVVLALGVGTVLLNSLRFPINKKTQTADDAVVKFIEISKYSKRLGLFKKPAAVPHPSARRHSDSDVRLSMFTPERLRNYDEVTIDIQNNNLRHAGKPKTKKRPLIFVAPPRHQSAKELGSARDSDGRENKSVRPHYMRL